MKIRHFSKESNISDYDKTGIETLIQECDFIYKKDISSLIDERDEKSLMCIYDNYGEVCGFASVTDNGQNLELSEIFIGLGFRGDGYGKALLKNVIDYSKKLNYDVVTLRVTVDNTYAQKFYEKNNFIITSCKEKSNTISMKRFNSNIVYQIGGILYELEKANTKDGIREGLEKIKNLEPFYKYFIKPNDEKINKRLQSKTINTAIDLLEEKKPEAEEQYVKKALLCLDCYYDLKKQEIERQRFIKNKNKWSKK